MSNVDARPEPFPFALVCLDLDGTVIDPEGGDAAPRAALWSLLAAARTTGTRLAFATGRSAGEVRQLVGEGLLPRPDFLLAEIGTALYEWPDDEPRELAVASPPAAWSGELVASAVASLPEIQPRLPARSGVYKKSFYLGVEEQAGVTAALARRLGGLGVRSRILFAPPRYLYLIPEGCGKEVALGALAARLHLEKSDILVAGDNELDRALLAEFPYAILVGNAAAAIKEEVRRLSPHVYIAVGRGAAGVREGMEKLMADKRHHGREAGERWSQ
jgi:hydroxymethylpyrimidine pyrophosphatase-like HAD family hydrolase